MKLYNQFHKLFFSFPRSILLNNLGTVCLSRSDKPLFDKGKKSTTTKGRKNIRSIIKDITADHLICHGKDEKYKWEDICNYGHGYRPCHLKNGDIETWIELNPG